MPRRQLSAVLDCEIACLDPGLQQLLRAAVSASRAVFLAFDLLMLDGEDVRGFPLLERKRLLLDVMPRIESRVRYVDHVHETGVRFFELACERDLEGIVAKYTRRVSKQPRDHVMAKGEESELLAG